MGGIYRRRNGVGCAGQIEVFDEVFLKETREGSSLQSGEDAGENREARVAVDCRPGRREDRC